MVIFCCLDDGGVPLHNDKQVKVKSSLCLSTMPWRCILYLIKYHAMKTYQWSRGIAPCTANLSLNGGKWSASCSGCFNSRGRNPGTHWMGPRGCLDTMV